MLHLMIALIAQAEPVIDPAIFAPGVEQVRQHLTATQNLVSRSEAIGKAVSRLHNRWSERLIHAVPTCGDSEAMDLAARTVPFGIAYRDAVQSARAEASRLARLLESPTITPILSPTDRQLAERLLRAIRDQARVYAETSAWQALHIEPIIRKCAPQISGGPGFPLEVPQGSGEPQERIAIIGIGGGFLCPGDHPADGNVVVIEGGRACYGASACDCVLERVFPAAILGAGR